MDIFTYFFDPTVLAALSLAAGGVVGAVKQKNILGGLFYVGRVLAIVGTGLEKVGVKKQ